MVDSGDSDSAYFGPSSGSYDGLAPGVDLATHLQSIYSFSEITSYIMGIFEKFRAGQRIV